MTERRVIYSVVQDSYGLRVEWAPELIDVLGEDGAEADRAIDLAEELLDALDVAPAAPEQEPGR